MGRGDVTEREFESKEQELSVLREELNKTRQDLAEAEEALAVLHDKYDEQQTALSSAMAGWTEAANLQFSLVQELKTAEAKLQTLQSERDMLWQHLGNTASTPRSVGTPRQSPLLVVADWAEADEVKKFQDQISERAAAAAAAPLSQSPHRKATICIDAEDNSRDSSEAFVLATLVSKSEGLVCQMQAMHSQMSTEIEDLRASLERADSQRLSVEKDSMLLHANDRRYIVTMEEAIQKLEYAQAEMVPVIISVVAESQQLEMKLQVILQQARNSRAQGFGML